MHIVMKIQLHQCKTTLRRVFLLLFVCLTYGLADAVPAKPGFTTFTQSDGTTIRVQTLGDEFHHSFATADGLTIARGDDGDFYYLTSMGITSVRAHDINNRTETEKAYVENNHDQMTMAALSETKQVKGKMRSRRAPTGPLRATQVPNNGSPRVPIILVQYTDKAMSNTKAQFVTHYTSLGAKSVRQYFVDQSNGLYDPQFDVYGIYTLPSNRATYGGNDSSGDDKGVALMVGDAITKAGNDIDWSLYDNNHDGEADVCIVVYAGVGEAQASSTVPSSIWPCQWSLSSGAYYGDGNGAVTRNGTRIDKFAVFNEVNGSIDSGTTMDGIGTFCHEFSHCLGLPDFYETTYRYGYYGMGGWSLMNSGSYNGITIDGDTPIGYSAYEKNFMGWLDYITPVENTYYTLPVFNSKIAENDQAVKITALNENEYWILENRKKQGWDYCIADEGVLITHFTYIADRWTANTVNNQAVQLATIIPADNSLTTRTENADLYGETNHAFTTSSTPAMKANMSANGTLASSAGGAGTVNKPVTEITLNSDGTASFWYIKGTIPSLTAPVLADASNVQYTSFVATWTHTPSASCTYTLNVTKNGTTIANVTGITEKTYTVTGLTEGETYQFKVKAVPVNTSQATESAWSNVKTVTLPEIPVPTITANPTSLSFSTVNVGSNGQATFTVTGENLSGNITATLSGGNGAFALSSNSITAAEAANGKTITVTFTPSGNGNYTGTVTLTSNGAQNVTVDLSGTGHVITPTINVSSNTLSYDATYVNETSTKKFTVTGSDLSDRVTLTLNDPNGVFSLSQQSVTAAVAMNGTGREITVTFAPTAVGEYTATITLNSTGATAKTVTLNAHAVEHQPALTASTQNINFGTVEPNEQTMRTFTLNGEYLLGDVTLTLNNANGVFSLSDNAVSKAEAEAGKTVTVNFSAAEEATYTGSITVSTTGLQNITIQLRADVSSGGTARDAYLDIAKYATIDEAGWNTTYVDNIYKYTEYADDGVAWLTLPVFGAWCGFRYQNNNGPQKWIKASYSSSSGDSYSNVSVEGSWSASDIHLGSSPYFTSKTARRFGNTSTNASSKRTISFYVTDIKEVKLLGKNNNVNLSNYPTTLTVYKCNKNADGTITETTTVAGSARNTTKNASFNLTVSDLDENQVYKVEAGFYRAQLYEIGFKTTLPSLTVNPVELDYVAEPNETQVQTFTVTGKKIKQDVTVALTDPNGCYSVSPTVISAADAAAGATVTVTLNAPAQEGSYRAQMTLTSGELSANVGIFGSVGEKGSAFSQYLDIQKYPSIGLDNWYEGLFDKPYDYTEDLTNNCAWLTVPALMSYAGFMFNDQNWTGVSRYSNYYSGLDWDATDVFKGNTFFYGNNTAFVMGSNSTSTSNTQVAYMIYNVTNCSQVKAYCYNNGASTSYPAIIQIYELTENADGTLTSSDSYVDNQITSTQYGDVTVTSATLDPNKIYEVFVAGARSFFYEVAFKTPIPTVTLAELVSDGIEGNTYHIQDNDIVVVGQSADGKSLYCKDNNAYDESLRSQIVDGQIDYVVDKANLQTTDWDQSNWVVLESDSEFAPTLVGKQLKNVLGKYTDMVNPTIKVSADLTGVTKSSDFNTEYNNYVTCNFNGPTQVGNDGNTYFFMTPKPMEVAWIHWAMWDGEKFVVPDFVEASATSAASNALGLDGGFYANFDGYDGIVPSLKEKSVYDFIGLVKIEAPSGASSNNAPRKAATASNNHMVYPISQMREVGSVVGGVVTSVNDLNASSKGAVEVGRYNVSGQRVDSNYRGVVIVLMSDGTAHKVIVK